MAVHQLSDDILADYVSGNLPEAFDLVVASHVSICEEARARLDSLEHVGGAILEELAPAEMSFGSLEATLKRIQSGAPVEVPAVDPAPKRQTGDILPGPIQDYVGGGLDAVRWRPIGLGAKQAILQESKSSSVRLLYIPAGSAMPDHGHSGTEMTLVLQGAFLDGDERFARGDVEVADEDLHHTPVADLGEDCICLAASVGKLKFDALLPRLTQGLFRI